MSNSHFLKKKRYKIREQRELRTNDSDFSLILEGSRGLQETFPAPVYEKKNQDNAGNCGLVTLISVK